jgi:hypothetical protein
MPELNVPFTDDEWIAVRAAAQRSEQSLRSFVHGAAVAAAGEPTLRVAEIAHEVAARSAELNRRLADS